MAGSGETASAVVPRSYQLELLEQAKVSNTIVLLRTGGGKTLVAVELIKHYLLTGASRGVPHIVFLCPTKVLASQQAEVVSIHGAVKGATRLPVQVLTAETRDDAGNNVDLWKNSVWRKFLSTQRVLVSTPELVLRALNKGLLHMKSIALIVVDECHHAVSKKKVSKHPVATIFREHYHAADPSQRPRILGLTASAVLGKTKTQAEVLSLMEKLQQALDCRIFTVKDTSSLDAHVPKPTHEMVEFCDTDSIKPGSEKLARALLRVTLSTQLLKLRRVYKFVRYQPIRDQLKDALGAKYLKGADGAADSEAGFVFQTESGDVGVGHVKELCRQIEQLVVQLGPLCGLLALYACFEPDGESASDLDGIRYKALSTGGGPTSTGLVDIEKLLESAASLRCQGSFPLSDLLNITKCVAASLAELVEYVLQLVQPHSWDSEEVTSSLRKARASNNSHDIKANLFDACKAGLSPFSGADTFEQALNGRSGHPFLVTKKLQLLAKILLESHKLSPDACILCFVEMRVTSAALAQLLMRSPAHAVLLPSYIIGGSSMSVLRQSLKEQRKVLSNFDGGSSKLLIATEVAEEGLDIQTCQTVISFDPPKRPKGFIQRRGRARAHGGKMYIFVPESDEEARLTMQQFVDTEKNMNSAAYQAGEDEDDDDDVGYEVTSMTSDAEQFIVASTGARVAYNSAVALLHHYCQVIAPKDNFYAEVPLFWRQDSREPFKVYLGVWAPVRYAEGRLHLSSRDSKGSAALALVRALHAARALDDHLSPVPAVVAQSHAVDPDKCLTDSQWIKKKLRGRNVGVYGRDDRGAFSIDCETICVPRPLRHQEAGSETAFAVHRLQVALGHGLDDMCALHDSDSGSLNLDAAVLRHLCASIESHELWTILPLPTEASNHTLWYRGRYELAVNFEYVGERVVTEEELCSGKRYHRQTFTNWSQEPRSTDSDTAVDAQQWTQNGAKPFYVLSQSADWSHPPEKRLKHDGVDVLKHKLVMVKAKHSGSHYIVPQGPPAGTPLTARSFIPAKEPPTTFQEYYRAQYGVELQRPDEPLVPAFITKEKPTPLPMEPQKMRKSSPLESGANIGNVGLGKSRIVHLPAELLEPVLNEGELLQWHASRALPYLMWSLEQVLVAHELHGKLLTMFGPSGLPAAPGVSEQDDTHVVPSIPELLVAITSASCGRAFSLERLEILGDAFLKLEVSTQLCQSHPTCSEGALTQMRSEIVSNRSLALRCASLGIAKYLRLQPFMIDGGCVWRPPGVMSPAEGGTAVSREPGTQLRTTKLKVLGDMLEALIGAFVSCGGVEGGRVALRRLGVLTHDDGPKSTPAVGAAPVLGDSAPLPPFAESSLRLGPTDAIRREAVSGLCDFTFCSNALVREALTHCSMQFEVSYQRLEFLGDAVLDFIVTNTLYNSGRKPGFTPGQITLRRVQLVRNNTLARRCVQLGLHSWIRHLSSPLASGISATVRAVDESGERDADTSFPMLAEENGDDSPMAGTEEILEQDGAGNGDDSSEDVGDVAPQAERARGSLVGVSLCKACADVVESLIGVMYLEARQHAKSANGDRGDCMSEGQQAGPSAGADSRLAAAGHLRWRDAALAAVAETVLGRIMDRDDLAAALT